MNIVVESVIALVIFNIGVCVGVVLHKWLRSRSSYDGTIFTSATENKLVYSLELHEDAEELQFKDEVVFKVRSS